MKRVAVILDAVYDAPLKHLASCQSCTWREEARSRRKALRLAAGHALDHDFHMVKVETIAVDFVVSRPDTARWREHAIPPLPEAAASGRSQEPPS